MQGKQPAKSLLYLSRQNKKKCPSYVFIALAKNSFQLYRLTGNGLLPHLNDVTDKPKVALVQVDVPDKPKE